MPKLVEQIICPLCGRHQMLKAGTHIPVNWFPSKVTDEFIAYRNAYGGQGRGVKGSDVKKLSGFVLYKSYNLHESNVISPASVEAVYKSAKALIRFLEEEVGLRE